MKKFHKNKKIINPEVYDKIILNTTTAPDPEKHQTISFLKSITRILGYLVIPYSLWGAVIILVISEGIGIIEELV